MTPSLISTQLDSHLTQYLLLLLLLFFLCVSLLFRYRPRLKRGHASRSRSATAKVQAPRQGASTIFNVKDSELISSHW